MKEKHSVIIIPGLSDQTTALQWSTYYWRKYGLDPIVHPVGWRDAKEKEFQPKLDRLSQVIDTLYADGHTISLVGTSAGGSMVINALVERKNKIHRVVNVCGRLRVGPTAGFQSFPAMTLTSPPFAESVRRCEEHLGLLTPADKQKILTIHPLFDELVPPETTIIEGADNRVIPVLGHGLGISLSLTLWSQKINEFLTGT